MMDNLIKLQTDTILQVPLQNYPRDFTFVVNGEHFPTSKFCADLLSSKISKLHQSDPTISEYNIQTNNKGDFRQILNLLEFNQSEINDNKIPFFSEIIEKLEIEKLDINTIEPELSLNNIIEMIKKHDKTRYFYLKKLSLDVDFLSENFYQLNDDQIQDLVTLHEDTIEKIISNDKLSLLTEDQLLKFILKLCNFNKKYNSMYEYVYFENVSNEQLELFVNNFNIEYITIGTWKSISKRLFQAQNFNRMKKNKIFKEICYPKNSNDLKGIIGYFRSIYSNIEEEIKITPSSYPANNNCNLNDLNNLLYIERKSHGFYTDNQQNSWLCFEFKNHRIIPTGYTIRSHHVDKGSTHPKKWFIEVSNDSKNFEVIDKQDIGDKLNGSYIVKSFPISNEKINLEKGFKFIRIRQDGVNCYEHLQHLQHLQHVLHISSIEFYGKIINY